MHIAVPAEYVEHVARLIAELDQRERPLPPPARQQRPAQEERGTDWPVEELRRFAQGRSRTHETVVAILDLLASRPEQRLPVTEIATGLGSSVDKVIGALGGLTRIVKAYHDYPALGLPLRRTLHRVPGRTAGVSYSVSTEQARRWLLVRGVPGTPAPADSR